MNLLHKSPRQSTARTTAIQASISFLIITSGILCLLFLYAVRTVLLQLVVAIILAIALTPLLNRLMKWKFKRVAAAITTVFITLIVLLAIIGAIASPLITQGDDLVRNAPSIVQKASQNPQIKQLDQKYDIIAKAEQFSKKAPSYLSKSGGPVLGVVGSFFGAVSSALIILVLVLFLLIEGPTAWSQFIRLLNSKTAHKVDGVAHKIVVAVGGFVNGNLFISLIAGVVALVTLLVAGVPYAFALAALVAIFDLIPLIGATLATVVVALVALSQGLVTALIVVGVLLVYQFVEGNVIQPVVYNKAVKLSQLLILVATVVGAVLGGVVGVLLAIPVAATVQIIVVELLRASGANIDPEVNESVGS